MTSDIATLTAFPDCDMPSTNMIRDCRFDRGDSDPLIACLGRGNCP